MRHHTVLQQPVCGSMQIYSKDYAAVCGLTSNDCAAVCGLTNNEYAAVCGFTTKSMRQYADLQEGVCGSIRID